MKNTKQMRIEYNEQEDQFEIYTRENASDDWGLYRAYQCKASAEEPYGVSSFIHFDSMLTVATLAAKGYAVTNR